MMTITITVIMLMMVNLIVNIDLICSDNDDHKQSWFADIMISSQPTGF